MMTELPDSKNLETPIQTLEMLAADGQFASALKELPIDRWRRDIRVWLNGTEVTDEYAFVEVYAPKEGKGWAVVEYKDLVKVENNYREFQMRRAVIRGEIRIEWSDLQDD